TPVLTVSLPPRLANTDVRRNNVALIAHTLADAGMASRSELAAHTGMAPGTVTSVVTDLLRSGVIEELAAPRGGRSAGRPQIKLTLSARGFALAVLTLDADAATAVLADITGQELRRVRLRHGRPLGDPEAILDVCAAALGSILEDAAAQGRRIADLSVVVFAPIGGDPAVVLASTDLDWERVDILNGLRARIAGLPDAVLTSSAVELRAELDGLEETDDILYATSDTGIGGTIRTAGRFVTGARGMAGVIGHIPVDHGGAACLCGQHGCLVTVAGPDIVLASAGLDTMAATVGLHTALDEFVARVRAGEPHAVAAWDDARIWIVRALRVAAALTDPAVVILGGYWADLIDSIAQDWENEVWRTLPLPVFQRPAFRAARFGRNAAIRGALLTARDRVLAEPLRIVGISASTY
ncbi:MAG: ROK family transcriptional regulator, partial [Gordonia sp. (in: high G+C Gram-positive bacteria)]